MIHEIDGSPVKMGRQMFGPIACTCVRVCNGCHDGNKQVALLVVCTMMTLDLIALDYICLHFTSEVLLDED